MSNQNIDLTQILANLYADPLNFPNKPRFSAYVRYSTPFPTTLSESDIRRVILDQIAHSHVVNKFYADDNAIRALLNKSASPSTLSSGPASTTTSISPGSASSTSGTTSTASSGTASGASASSASSPPSVSSTGTTAKSPSWISRSVPNVKSFAKDWLIFHLIITALRTGYDIYQYNKVTQGIEDFEKLKELHTKAKEETGKHPQIFYDIGHHEDEYAELVKPLTYLSLGRRHPEGSGAHAAGINRAIRDLSESSTIPTILSHLERLSSGNAYYAPGAASTLLNAEKNRLIKLTEKQRSVLQYILQNEHLLGQLDEDQLAELNNKVSDIMVSVLHKHSNKPQVRDMFYGLMGWQKKAHHNSFLSRLFITLEEKYKQYEKQAMEFWSGQNTQTPVNIQLPQINNPREANTVTPLQGQSNIPQPSNSWKNEVQNVINKFLESPWPQFMTEVMQQFNVDPGRLGLLMQNMYGLAMGDDIEELYGTSKSLRDLFAAYGVWGTPEQQTTQPTEHQEGAQRQQTQSPQNHQPGDPAKISPTLTSILGADVVRGMANQSIDPSQAIQENAYKLNAQADQIQKEWQYYCSQPQNAEQCKNISGMIRQQWDRLGWIQKQGVKSMYPQLYNLLRNVAGIS